MITDKQKQRDYEYDGDYQSKSRYTIEQWTNILESGQLEDSDLTLLKQIYSSFNHAATLLQLSFQLELCNPNQNLSLEMSRLVVYVQHNYVS